MGYQINYDKIPASGYVLGLLSDGNCVCFIYPKQQPG